jgi:uracil phosphoribosyltransferase
MPLRLVHHPLAGHFLLHLRDKSTAPEHFRALCNGLTTILALEATKGMRTAECGVETPLETTSGTSLAEGLAAVPVLRAGLGMLDAIVSLFPNVSVGYIGLARDDVTAVASNYYCKLPDLRDKFSLCIDPMLATGGTACQALALMKEHGADRVVMLSVVATSEGIERVASEHPDVEVVCAAVDRGLNDNSYILPGLGDFGDRLYGTV